MKRVRAGINPWPLGIVAAFVLFAAGTAALVVTASRRHSELVATDYYDQEIAFQQRLDELRRTEPFATEIAVDWKASPERIRLSLPKTHAAAGLTGRVAFYRPSDAGRDRTVPLRPDAAGRQDVRAQNLASGLWRVRLEWESGGQQYFAERRLVVSRRPGSTL